MSPRRLPWCAGLFQHWRLSCRALRRRSTPVLLVTTLFWKIFELNKVTTTLLAEGQWEQGSCTVAAGCTTGSREQLRREGRDSWVLLLAAGGRGCDGEYICVRGNVWFCLLWVLLKIYASGKKCCLFAQYFDCSIQLRSMGIHAPLIAADILIFFFLLRSLSLSVSFFPFPAWFCAESCPASHFPILSHT